MSSLCVRLNELSPNPGSQDYKLRVIGRDGLAQWRVLSVLPVRKPEPPRQMLQELLEVLRTAPAYFRDRCLQGSAAALFTGPTCSVRELSPTA